MNSSYSTLTPEDARREIKRMKKATDKLLASRGKATKFLIGAGILEKNGKRLAAQYR